MSGIKYPIKGACQCGQVTYQLLAAPLMVVACHCRECQKLSTSAFSITAVVKATDIEFTGEMLEWSRLADNGNTSAAKFCPGCGNRIYHFNPDDLTKLKLKPSTLEDTQIIQPSMHIWTSEKQTWFEIPTDLPLHEKQPF